MTERTDFAEEVDKRLNEAKSELGFKSSIDDLNRIFFVKDFILKEGFISEKISRQICYRIVETYVSWNDYLHSILMPNPQNILNMSESKIFNQEERKKIIEIMKKIMGLTSRNSCIALKMDKREESKFIDDAINFWETDFKNSIFQIMKKINEEWEK